MTIHVLHAGGGYTYLTRSVAAHDRTLGGGDSLADYYTAHGHPPGRWAGRGVAGLGGVVVGSVVSEAQMKALFGEGRHPDADQIEAQLVARGVSPQEALRATQLGRRFPQYRRRQDLLAVIRTAYKAGEKDAGRALSVEEKGEVRRRTVTAEFVAEHGRAPLDEVELRQFTGEQLGKNRDAVAGYDFVFTPVKSVAVLWGIGSEATRRQIFEAHQAAVSDAVAWLEDHAAFTRTGDVGQAQIDTAGLIAGMFHHWDSRAGDPDLHTHVAVSNKVQGPDQKWRSLDGRALFAAAVSVSERYNTRIEDELRTRLGVQFTERPDGGLDARRPVREVAGVPVALIRGFSKRRHGIEQTYQDLLGDFRQDYGREPDEPARRKLYQQATLTDRPDKPDPEPLADMITGWRAEADRILGVPAAAEAVEAAALRPAPRPAAGELSVAGLAELTLRIVQSSRATWTEHNVRAEAHRQTRAHPVGDRDHLVEQVVAAACDPARTLRIQRPRAVSEPAPLQRANGESVFDEHASARYTTVSMLDAEERIVAAARRCDSHTVPAGLVEQALTESAGLGRTLSSEQQRLAREFATSGMTVQLGLAAAGTGKTTTMRVVVQAWQASGRPVIALAPSAVAADVLGTELAIPADTMAKFDYENPALEPGTLILVDEAGMAGTLMVDRLVSRAVDAGAVVRLLGDDQQLAAVEAGGVIRQIAHDVGAVRMHGVVRFDDPAEAAATLQVRDGDAGAVDFYIDSHRIRAGTAEEMPAQAYAAWLADTHAGLDALLIASSGEEVTTLNGQARGDLVAAGLVGVDGVGLRDGSAAGVGDHVATRKNSRSLAVNRGKDWVKNGDGWRVLAVHDDGALTVEHRTHLGRATLPSDYVAEHVELDYARTVHRAQGLTVDRTHLLVDPNLTREALYVGVSRARKGTDLYVAVATDPGPGHRPDVAGNAQEVLASIIERSGAEQSATDTVRAALAASVDLRGMASEYEHALGVAAGDRHHAAAERVHAGLTEDPAWPAVAVRLRRAEAAGWDVGQILRQAAGMRGFSDAESDAQVMTWRLDLLLDTPRNARVDAAAATPVPTWLATEPPARPGAPWDAYLPARYAEIRQRVDSLAGDATRTRPPWFAELPADPVDSTRALRQVVAYRAVYNVTTPEHPIGPEPGPGRRRQAWRAADAALHPPADPAPATSNAARLAAQLDRTPPVDTDNAGPTRRDDGPTRHR